MLKIKDETKIFIETLNDDQIHSFEAECESYKYPTIEMVREKYKDFSNDSLLGFLLLSKRIVWQKQIKLADCYKLLNKILRLIPNCSDWIDIPKYLEELLSNGGDKLKLKKQIQELENENMVLKNLVRGLG